MIKMKKKKITIFGHTGFLGKNIISQLNKKKINIFLPPRNKFKFSQNLGSIIYCIGSDDIIKNPLNAVVSNLLILSKIIEQNKFETFTYISSTRLYLNTNKTNENDDIKVKVSSKNYLFNSLKVAAENFCLSKNNKKIKVVRLSNLYGPNFSNQVYLLPSLIRDSLKKKKIKILINKKSKKNYLYVNDAIKIILKIINKSKYRIYNIASNKRISLENIALTIKEATNCKIVYKNQNIRLNEPVININRIKKEYNFKPENNFEKLIFKIIKDSKY